MSRRQATRLSGEIIRAAPIVVEGPAAPGNLAFGEVACRGQIAHYTIPRYVRSVDSFPMTVTGKVQKYVMREHMAHELAVTAPGTA